MSWPISWSGCPDNMREMLRAYVETGALPPAGHHLRAILENDWRWTSILAPVDQGGTMRDLADWMHHTLPPACWGSCRAVTAWVEAKRVAKQASAP